MRSPATPGWARVACVCGAARAGVCVVCLWRSFGCGCVFRVCWRVCGGVWRFVSLPGACCWCRCGWGCGWCVCRPSPLLAEVPACVSPPLLAAFRCRGGRCSSLLLAEGPGCGPLPLLAGVRQRWWCVVACPSWVWSWLRFPATPRWGLRAAAVAVCVGLGGGFSWCVCLWRSFGCGCVFRVCWRVCGGVWRFVSLAGACCWCRCGWG